MLGVTLRARISNVQKAKAVKNKLFDLKKLEDPNVREQYNTELTDKMNVPRGESNSWSRCVEAMKSTAESDNEENQYLKEWQKQN